MRGRSERERRIPGRWAGKHTGAPSGLSWAANVTGARRRCCGASAVGYGGAAVQYGEGAVSYGTGDVNYGTRKGEYGERAVGYGKPAVGHSMGRESDRNPAVDHGGAAVWHVASAVLPDGSAVAAGLAEAGALWFRKCYGSVRFWLRKLRSGYKTDALPHVPGGTDMGAGNANPEYVTAMSKGQKSKYDQVKQIVAGWEKIRASKTLDGQTLAQFTAAKLKPCNDARDVMAGLKLQKIAAANAIKKADEAAYAAAQDIVKAVRADKSEGGDDGDLYEAMGFVRRSERKSGLSRKKTAEPDDTKK